MKGFKKQITTLKSSEAMTKTSFIVCSGTITHMTNLACHSNNSSFEIHFLQVYFNLDMTILLLSISCPDCFNYLQYKTPN